MWENAKIVKQEWGESEEKTRIKQGCKERKERNEHKERKERKEREEQNKANAREVYLLQCTDVVLTVVWHNDKRWKSCF